eukprot:COSAG03_NODE_263_length_9732_cov_34.907194_7_plen_81_part_00
MGNDWNTAIITSIVVAPRDSSLATIDTYVDKRRSYCESCGTHKTGVQWWTTEFRPTNQERNVMSACKACVKHVPKVHRPR